MRNREIQCDMMLPELAMYVCMFARHSYELNLPSMKWMVRALEHALETWEAPREEEARFDAAVKELIESALEEFRISVRADWQAQEYDCFQCGSNQAIVECRDRGFPVCEKCGEFDIKKKPWIATVVGRWTKRCGWWD